MLRHEFLVVSNHQQQWMGFGVRMVESGVKLNFMCEIALSFMWRCEKKKKTKRNDEK